nr:hypothetical protein [Lactimicrobium massiliense]
MQRLAKSSYLQKEKGLVRSCQVRQFLPRHFHWMPGISFILLALPELMENMVKRRFWNRVTGIHYTWQSSLAVTVFAFPLIATGVYQFPISVTE